MECAASPEERAKILVEELTDEKRTISARFVWASLEALLERSQMDTYFVQLGVYTSYPMTYFGAALLEHMERQILPKLKYVLAQAIDTQRPSLVVKAILLISIIVNGIRPLPDGLEPFLLDRLRRLVRAMASEDYSSMQGYTQLAGYIQSLAIPPADEGVWRELSRLQSRLARH